MADEAREYVRAAQEAELRGDALTAAQLLIKAASIYRTTGRLHRALTMLKHARRLDDSRVDLDEQIRRLEWLPESPLESPDVGALSLEAEMQRILAPLEVSTPATETPQPLPGDASRPLVERGPTRADPDARAWCSFCCNPGEQVGALIAGPAGAFACRSCLETSLELLGGRTRGPVASPPSTDAGFVELPSQCEAIAEIERLLGRGRRRILLVGPPGAGKSVVLERAAVHAGGTFVRGGEPGALPTVDRPLFLDGPFDPEALASRSAPVVFSLSGTAPASSIRVEVDGQWVIVPGTAALHAATAGALTLETLESVDGVVVLAALDEEGLARLAEARLRAGGHEGEQVPELARVLASEAAASGRGAHELLALLRRVPGGAVRIVSSTPELERKRRGRAKKEKGA